jgi:hypothetical protein
VADDKMVRLSPEVHTELKRVADDQKQQIGNLADALLEYVMRSADRVEAAITERQQRGFAKTRARRGGDGSWEPAASYEPVVES